MKGGIIFKGIAGMGLFALFWVVAWHLPNMNITFFGLDFTSMDTGLVNVARLGILAVSFAFMFWWSSDVV